MTSEPATLETIRHPAGRISIRAHDCFACGSLNEHGLQLQLHAAVGQCWTELELPTRFGGWEGIAHGGIVATILDEVMAWALIEHDHWGVTARMTVEYKRPVPVGSRIRGEGRVVDVKRRVVTAAGRLLDADGQVLAASQGLYVAAPEAQKAELKARYAFRIIPEEGAGAPR